MPLWSDQTLFDRVIDLLTQKKKGYVKFNKARDSITDYFRPDLGSDTRPDGDGSFFGENIYEGTGPWAARVMASGFQGNLVSESASWLLHELEQHDLKGIDALDAWMQDVSRYMADVYRKSNYYTILNRFVLDGVTIGSPVKFIEEDVLTATIKFLPQHYKNVYLFYDRFNQVEGIIVEDETWTVKKMFDKFAGSQEKADAKFSEKVLNDLRQGQFHSEHTVIRAIFKTSNPVWDGIDGFKKPNAEWTGVYFDKDTDEDKKYTPLETDKYFSRPFGVWDIDKKPWESVSRTPAFEAIYDVISSGTVFKDYLENQELKIRPPRKVNPLYRNAIDFSPEGITEVNKADWDTAVGNIDLIGDVLLNKDLSELLSTNIKRWFRTDNFIKFTDLTNNLREQPTATQIIKMAAEIAIQLIPEISTFTGGYLRDVDTRMIDIESRAGRGPFDRRTIENINDIVASNSDTQATSVEISPIFVGQLARAQKVKQDLDPILDGLAAAAPLFALDEDLILAVKGHETLDDIFSATNFPMKNFVSKDEFDAIKEAILEQRAAQQQIENNIEMAKAAKSVSGPVDETSVLANVVGGQGG